VKKQTRKETVLVIPDIHAPFNHPDAFDFLRDLAKAYKPTKIVCLGDEMDAHALSEWDTDPDGLSPEGEWAAGLVELKTLYKLFPKVQVCTSNHTSRPFRKAFKSGLPTRFLREYRDFMEAPNGWSWEDRIVIDGVQYLHGEGYTGSKGAIKAAMAQRQSTVIGHIHSFAGVEYSATKHDLIFGMNAGWLGDEKAYAFKYGKHHANRGILGAGIVHQGHHALFIPMERK
jgi:hypothetical protein